MGHGHASSGLCFGLAFGDALTLAPSGVVALGLAMAGACTIPDIDCKGSTAATAFGPFSQFIHYGAIELHHMVADSLHNDYDHQHSPHRGLTHWWPFWLVSGTAVWLGCSINQWVVMGVLAVLFALAARGLTIPDLPAETQGRFDDSLRHHLMMRLARAVLYLCPFTWLMIRVRKHVAKTRRYGWWLVSIRFGVGKVATAAAALGAAWFLTSSGVTAQLGPWMGLLVGGGMALHYIGDCPTHMGVPGLRLNQAWKLPFWASFYAGGPFEIIAIWFSLGWLNILLLPGLLTHGHQMTVMLWVGAFLGVVVILAILIEATSQVNRRRYAA